MPVVFRQFGVRFFFYSNEGNPREPIHVHALRAGLEAKFWVIPEVSVAYNDGYSAREQRALMELVEANKDLIVRTWNEFFRA